MSLLNVATPPAGLFMAYISAMKALAFSSSSPVLATPNISARCASFYNDLAVVLKDYRENDSVVSPCGVYAAHRVRDGVNVADASPREREARF